MTLPPKFVRALVKPANGYVPEPTEDYWTVLVMLYKENNTHFFAWAQENKVSIREVIRPYNGCDRIEYLLLIKRKNKKAMMEIKLMSDDYSYTERR